MAQQISLLADMAANSRLLEMKNRHPNFRWHSLRANTAFDEITQVNHLCEAINKLTDDLQGFNVYLTGSQGFCSSTEDMLVKRGLAPEHCYFDPTNRMP
jgi:ferredoxin-NADP reductase